MWKFRCDKYPKLVVTVSGGRFARFAASIFSTDDSEVADILKNIPDVVLESDDLDKGDDQGKTKKKK